MDEKAFCSVLDCLNLYLLKDGVLRKLPRSSTYVFQDLSGRWLVLAPNRPIADRRLPKDEGLPERPKRERTERVEEV